MEQFWEVLWKSAIAFVLLVVLARIIGRKLLSQMTFFDFVITIIVGTIAGNFVTTGIKGNWVLLSPIILTFFVLIVSIVTIKSIPVRKLLQGEPVVVIQNGMILEHNLQKLRYTLQDLEMQLRQKNIFNITDVEFAVLEPDGKMSVLKKAQRQTVTMKDLGKPTTYKGMSTEIIKDGVILEENLSQNNLDFNWLYKELRQRGINDVSEVFYASLESDGTLYTDIRKDQLNYVQKVED